MAAFVPVRLPLASAVRPPFPPHPFVRLVLQMSFWPGFTSADRAVLDGLAASVKTITTTLGKIMSEDATVAAEVADTDAKIGTALTLLGTVQALILSLQQNETGLSQATLDLITKTQADAGALATAAQADVTADTPAAT